MLLKKRNPRNDRRVEREREREKGTVVIPAGSHVSIVSKKKIEGGKNEGAEQKKGGINGADRKRKKQQKKKKYRLIKWVHLILPGILEFWWYSYPNSTKLHQKFRAKKKSGVYLAKKSN